MITAEESRGLWKFSFADLRIPIFAVLCCMDAPGLQEDFTGVNSFPITGV